MFHFTRHHPAAQDVLVTGIGMITPLAIGAELSWQRLKDGATAGRMLTDDQIDSHAQLTELLKRPPGGAPVDHAAISDAARAVWSRQARGRAADLCRRFGADPLNNMVIVSLAEALQQAGLPVAELNRSRTGCVIGTSKASLRAMEQTTKLVAEQRSPNPSQLRDSFLSDAPLRAVLNFTGAQGPSSCPVAACATGLISVIQAAQLIHSGQCDVCIAGSADASLRASVLASFHRLGVTSRRPDPRSACRPFDEQRDGFIIGEGAAVFVLESRQHAEARRATHTARIVSGGWMTDPTGITQIDTSGAIVRSVIQQTLNGVPQSSDEAAEQVFGQSGFCCLHGTATHSNDLAEAQGLPDNIRAYGIKGAIGHLLGAAGSVELATTLLSLRDGVIPPTVNFTRRDPLCALQISNQPVTTRATSALKLSLGFGGHVAACLVSR
ncbi:MAG: beta-ketoacyl-[acyl-carrier-protein] synthase family protein [Fuerstiella sp.]